MVRSARTPFAALLELDQTIDLHLDGLAEAGPMGLELASEAFAKSIRQSGIDVAADSFVLLAAAALGGDDTTLHAHLAAAVQQAGGVDAVAGLFLWCHSPAVSLAFRACAQDDTPGLRAVLLAVAHAQEWPGASGDAGPAQDQQPSMAPEELHAIANCARADRLPAVLHALHSAQRGNEGERLFAAARAAVLLGDRRHGVEALHGIGLSTHPAAAEASTLLSAVLSPMHQQRYLQSLEQLGTKRLTCIAATGWSGDAAYIPWLLEHMRDGDDDAARAAGEAFRIITGCSLEANKLIKQAPAADKGAQADYPLPDANGLRRWWDEHRSLYTPGVRYFLGRSLTLDWIKLILQHGEQAHRELAALHLKLMRPDSALFPTNATAPRQLALLSTLTGVSP